MQHHTAPTTTPSHQPSQQASPAPEFVNSSQFQLPRGGSEHLPTLAEWNARYIEYVLNCTKGKKTAAARILGINRRTLYRRKKAEANQMAMTESEDVNSLPHPHQMQ